MKDIPDEIKQALVIATGADGTSGIYGAFNVSIGEGCCSKKADYMTMDSKNVFRCYEVKTSEDDFYCRAKPSFAGDYNYLVVAKDLYERVRQNTDDVKFYGCGIYVYDGYDLVLKRRAKPKTVHVSKKIELMYCMIRALSRYTFTEAMKQSDRFER